MLTHTHTRTQSNEGLANEFSQQINYILQTSSPNSRRNEPATFKAMDFVKSITKLKSVETDWL